MKNITNYILVASFSLALWALAEKPVQVTYTQVFADKKITVTEQITVWESLTIAAKKGFIKYEL